MTGPRRYPADLLGIAATAPGIGQKRGGRASSAAGLSCSCHAAPAYGVDTGSAEVLAAVWDTASGEDRRGPSKHVAATIRGNSGEVQQSLEERSSTVLWPRHHPQDAPPCSAGC